MASLSCGCAAQERCDQDLIICGCRKEEGRSERKGERKGLRKWGGRKMRQLHPYHLSGSVVLCFWAAVPQATVAKAKKREQNVSDFHFLLFLTSPTPEQLLSNHWSANIIRNSRPINIMWATSWTLGVWMLLLCYMLYYITMFVMLEKIVS